MDCNQIRAEACTRHAGWATLPRMSAPLAPDPDPRPQPPQAPLPQECCESGCPICVYDLYAEAMEEYRQALAAWRQRHPDAETGTS